MLQWLQQSVYLKWSAKDALKCILIKMLYNIEVQLRNCQKCEFKIWQMICNEKGCDGKN